MAVVHMVDAKDPRTSACGLLWWRGSPHREPATAAGDVTCRLCARTESYRERRFDVPPDRRSEREIRMANAEAANAARSG